MPERNYIHKFQPSGNRDNSAIFTIQSGGHYSCDRSFYENNYYKSGYYLIYVERGKGYFETPEGKFTANPQTMFWLDLSRPYKYYSDSVDPWVIHWLMFEGGIADYFSNRMMASEKYQFTLESEDEICVAFFALLENYLSSAQGERGRILLHQKLTDLLSGILLRSDSLFLARQEAYPDPVRLMISYMEQNYFRRITLDELAEVTYLNKYYMARLFKQHTGLAPCELVNRFRLEYGRQMLLSGEMGVEQIALNLGFHSHSYFTRRFKREYGLTPKEYREKSTR